MMQRICFLYIDEPYNIYHSISIAIALHQDSNSEVQILCTPRNFVYVSNILKDEGTTDLNVHIIRPFWYITLPHYLEIKLQHRYFLYKKYGKLLSDFDGIVCSLYNDLTLRKFIGDKPQLIFAGHGIANRSYSYDDKIKGFDYILLAGENEKSIRESLGQLIEGKYLITGYPKYDICENVDCVSPFQNEKPIVFYNPHWLKEYSSFYSHGIQILKSFSKQQDYNLIFAPHSLLITRNQSILSEINSFEKFSQIHIDTGSIHCHNMNYIKLSDIYLGDISSQALEFALVKNRPCLFVVHNKNEINSKEFHSLAFGKIIDSVENLADELSSITEDFNSKYHSIQSKEIPKLFYHSNKKASQIASTGITKYLSNGKKI